MAMELKHQASRFVTLVHDENFKHSILANALVWTSEHFDEFIAHIISGTDDEELVTFFKNEITHELFDIWAYPTVAHAGEMAERQSGIAGVIDVSQIPGIGELFGSILKGE